MKIKKYFIKNVKTLQHRLEITHGHTPFPAVQPRPKVFSLTSTIVSCRASNNFKICPGHIYNRNQI